MSQICSLFGGRVAEEMTLGKEGVTTGASNDIQRATEIARNMVTKWGLSEKMGPLMYDEATEEVFLGRSAGQQHLSVSGETAKQIDEEVRSIIDECYAIAVRLLEENVEKLHMMADALMTYETIDSEQIDDIMAGREPREPKDWGDSGGDAMPDPQEAGDDSGKQDSPAVRLAVPRRTLILQGRVPFPDALIPPALECAGRTLSLDRPVVMGVINTTPDSFSDGGLLYRGARLDMNRALARARDMVSEGARVLDIGGESTRPGAALFRLPRKWTACCPLLERINAELDVVVSVDTSTPA